MEFLQEELDEILNIFSQESTEILQSMDKNLLLLEKKPNSVDIAMHLFRDAHSLKGSARMLGFDDIQNIAHKIEDVLGLIREEKIKVDSNITDTISSALGLIGVLIKKTIEQKSEYKSKETIAHIEKLNAICKQEGNEKNKNDEAFYKRQALEKNFEKIGDYITSIILIYSKSVTDNNFEQFQDLISITASLSSLIEECGYGELIDISIALNDLASQYVNEENRNDDTLFKFNVKINEFIQSFNLLAQKNNIKIKDYYENAYKITQDSRLEINDSPNDEGKLKNVELIELVNKVNETISEINKNKHSLAEVKSLLNEIIARLDDDSFKKIYEIILSVILNFEQSNSKLEDDSLGALKEILISCEGIAEAKSNALKTYSDFGEEIDLLNQKALVVSQMINYELKSPSAGYERAQRTIKPVDWAESFDTTSIKTLRVNSDKLDKLVNQIGNLIVTRIKSQENISLVKVLQDNLIDLQKYYHKIGYYMKFYEKKYIQETKNEVDFLQKKDAFLSYNKQLISFHSANMEKMNEILNNLNFLMKELQENNIKLNTTTQDMENMVKSMRILPLSAAFNLFPRMVHNISKDKEKEIELTIEGADVSADKKIIEDIKIPIMHIIRNSIDHGIEIPKERERIGKKRTGSIILKATQKENKILISIKDDGRGINIEKIKQKAIEKGFVTKDAAQNMSKEQLANFIFYPGFSTGEVVTELSGRGLGLDIVHTKISQLNGRIDVYSEENKGTVVTLELPTTMATMKAFILKEKNQLFAVPTGNIHNVLRISPDEINEREGRHYFIYDNEAIPICRLSSILNYKIDENEEIDKYTIMVLKSESITLGLIIEKLIGDEEILHKKLPEPMLRVKNISGITTLANGEMCLLLNISDILNYDKVNPYELNTTKTLTLKDNSKYKILVVDDSITTRRLMKNVLSSQGYNPDIEISPKDALKLLETKKYDLIISDYEMGDMNGIEFVKILKAHQNTKDIPIIVVTSIEKTGLKEEFLRLGIQEFIKKEYFEQQSFIKTVNKYLNLQLNEGQ